MFYPNVILKGSRYVLAAALFLFLAIACRQTKKMPENMVAQVNDRYLLSNELEYSTAGNLDKNATLAFKKNKIASWVDEESLYQAALREGFKLSAREQFFIDEYTRALLVQRYLNSKLDKDYSVSRQDIEEFYSKNRKEFIRREDEVHIVHLFMEHRDKAIFAEIKKTDDLAALIKKYYFDEKSTSEQPNGDLGYVALSVLPDNFVRVLKRLKTGAVSKPIRTKNGYHFLQLIDSEKKGSVRDVDLVKNQIIFRLKRERREAEKERLLREAKNNVQIQTYLSKIQE